MKLNIRQLYLYLVSMISLVIMMIGAVSLIDLGLKMYVFKSADQISYYSEPVIPGEKPLSEEEKAKNEKELAMRQEKEMESQRQRQFSNSLAMVVVGGMVYYWHQGMIKKEKQA